MSEALAADDIFVVHRTVAALTSTRDIEVHALLTGRLAVTRRANASDSHFIAGPRPGCKQGADRTGDGVITPGSARSCGRGSGGCSGVDGRPGACYCPAMRFPGLMLIGTLALTATACGKATKPKLDESDLPRVAAEYVAVFNDMDAKQLAGLYGKKPDLVKQQARLTWLHEQLGACGEPVAMWQLELKRGRFIAECERGSFEFFMQLDGKGRLKSTIDWAVGIDTPDALAKAAATVVAAMPLAKADPGLKWHKGLKAGWVKKLGRCEVAGVRSVSRTSGRFDLQCEHGAALLKVSIGADGEVAGIKLWESNNDKTRAFKGEMLG